jgi:hypothetical protein
LVKATNGESDVYREPKNTYLRSDELDQYFDGNQKAWFVSNEYPEEILPLFHELGINALPKVIKKGPDKNGFIKIAESHGYHKRGLEGFDPDISVDGLEIAINNPTHQKSEFIWNKIAIENWPCIAGIIEKSSKKTYENSKKESMISDFGRLLINAKWLPDPSGDYLNPSKLSLAQLPNGFERETQRAKSLSVAIGMKQPEREQAIKIVTGGDRDLENLIDFYQAASDAERKKILKSIPQEISPEPAPSFKDALKSLGRVQSGVTDKETKPNSPVADTDRYQGKLNEDVEAGVQEHLSKSHKITFNSVRNTSSNSEARRFLYEEYKGHCQITETTFPKASKRSDGMAENYFEACALVSYSRADYLNDAGNMLCLSADTMAKLKFASVELLDDFEAIIHEFKESGETRERVSFKIRLAGEDRCITWSQRHFMRLVALYEEA